MFNNLFKSKQLHTIYYVFTFILLYGTTIYAGNITLKWDEPTTNSDGTPLDDLKGYKVYYDTTPNTFKNSINVDNVTTYTIDLTDGETYYFVITAYNTSNHESSYSNVITKFLPPPPPPDQDADGIIDNIDICPDTPEEEAANSEGCAPSQLDTDNDNFTPAQGDCDDTNLNVNPNAAEVCDNLDNDCDGIVDDNLSRATSCGVGVCSGNTGSETCSAGAWGNNSCDPLAGAAAETCDNLDNDCDGIVDDNLSRATSCGVGVCSGNTGSETCSAGAWGNNSCDPLAGAAVEIPDDGIDQNCNGADTITCIVDYDQDGYGTSDETSVLADDGACNTARYESLTSDDCNDSNDNVHPEANEICNSIDDDCDSLIDDNDDFVTGQTIWYLDADADGYSNGDTEFKCIASAGYYPAEDLTSVSGDCNDTPGSGEIINPDSQEICNNMDDDCDGSVDENLSRSTSCGVGVCSGNTGSETCSAGAWGNNSCDPLAGAAAETCDNLDNDCDGSVDENLSRSTSCGVGVCSGNTGSETCSAGAWGNNSCDPLAGAAAETCDNLDNDCDGIVDDNLSRSTSCGVGVCSGNTGSETCSAGAWGNNSCDPLAGAAAETCDNLDNDCDGSVDENLSRSTSCGVGVCSGNTGSETCSAGAWGNNSCDPLAGAAAETCDNLDNDCDGIIDNNPTDIGGECSAGEGTCMVNGTITCSAGSIICNAVPEAPGVEVCDGLDNDCDGMVDDNDPDVTGQESWYADIDSDSYGNPDSLVLSCVKPIGTVADNTDCNDSDISIHPGAAETAFNSIDEDCSGSDLEYFINCIDQGNIECIVREDGGNDSNNLVAGIATNTISFEFQVILTDTSNNAPQFVKMYMTQRNDPYIDDFYAYNMQCNTDYLNGSLCNYTTKLGPAAVHKFYYEAKMLDGTILRYPPTGYITGPEIQLLHGYNLIGIPRDLSTDLDGDTAFGSIATYRWNNDSGYYTLVTSKEPLVAGEGYYSLIKNPKLPELNEYNDIISPEYSYELRSGWNIISNPYTGNIRLIDIKVSKGNNTAISWTEAVSNGWLINDVYYNDGENSYNFESGQDAVLVPWMGYWIYMEMTDDIYYLVIPRPDK